MTTAFQSNAFQGDAFQVGTPGAAPAVVGGAGRRRRQRVVLDVEGRDLIFASIDAALAFLMAREPELEAVAAAKARSDAQRILQLGSSRVSIKPPALPFAAANLEVQAFLEEIEARVERAYSNALWSALMRDAEEIEDVQFIATLQ